MFVLTCPSCQHQVRVKYARQGATASCVSCRHRFKVEGDRVRSEGGIELRTRQRRVEAAFPEPGRGADGASGVAVLEAVIEETEHQKPTSRPARRPARPLDAASTGSGRAARGRPAEPVPLDAASTGSGQAARGGRVKTRDPVRGKPTRLLDSVRGHPISRLIPLTQLLRKLKPGLPILVAAGLSVVIGLFGLLLANSRSRPTELVHAEPDEPVVIQELQPYEPTAAEVEEVDPPKPVETASLATQASRTVARAQLTSLSDPYWSRLDPPAPPMSMLTGSTDFRGEVYLERNVNNGDGLIRGSYVLNSAKVHKGNLLHVRLIDPAGLSYAEIKRTLPVVIGRQGIDVAIPVPAEWLGQMGTVLVELTPGEVVENAVPLEPVQWRFSVLNGSEELRVVTLAVRNTSSQPVHDLRFALDAVDDRGAVVGSWQGKVEATVEPGKSIEFEAYISSSHDVTSERLVLRTYGTPQPVTNLDMGKFMIEVFRAYGLAGSQKPAEAE